MTDMRLMNFVHARSYYQMVEFWEWCDAIVCESTSITHLFVTSPPPQIVEDSIHIAIPYVVRSVGDVAVLRWFPKPYPQIEIN